MKIVEAESIIYVLIAGSLWRRSAHKLQLSNNAKLRDHTAVFVSLHPKSHVRHAPLADNPVWHKDALMNP